MELDGTVPIENWTVQYDSGDVTDTPSATQGGLEDERRSARKRRAILEAGTTVFLSNGYLGTSMDEVAKLAGVSKQTVYKHFADKQRLFSEIVTAIVDEIADPNTDEVLNLKDTGNLERDLRDFARRQLRAVMQPRLLQLRRLVIGEAGRFPQLGQLFYQRGPGRTIDTLATLFERLAARGELELDDARLAAAHFNWLVMSIPLNQAMLLGQDEPATANQLRRYADTGVKAFLAAYQNTDRHTSPFIPRKGGKGQAVWSRGSLREKPPPERGEGGDSVATVVG
jgi:TetR/AcrR family transcriptional regulator, mexJK operon transcriptional repressor